MPKNRAVGPASRERETEVGVKGLARAVKNVLMGVGRAFKAVVGRKPSSSM
jgi:hypothetical protein